MKGFFWKVFITFTKEDSFSWRGSNISKNANTLLKRTLWRVCRHAHYSKVGCVITRAGEQSSPGAERQCEFWWQKSLREFDDEKILMMKTQFEIKIVQFYVLEGKKIKITLIIGPKFKKYSILRRKNTELYPKKLLKTHLFSALKFGKVVDNKARFVWNDM